MGVTGIGGLFFRSRDPVARAAWYKTHLGIDAGGDSVWMQDAGMTVFAPFAADTDYFPADHAFMLNFRVEGIDALAEALDARGFDSEDPS